MTKPKRIHFALRMPQSEHAEMMAACKARGITLSHALRAGAREYLELGGETPVAERAPAHSS